MKRNVTMVVIGLICGILLSGCQKERTSEPNLIDRSRVNQAILESYSDLAIQNAIMHQASGIVSNSGGIPQYIRQQMTPCIDSCTKT